MASTPRWLGVAGTVMAIAVVSGCVGAPAPEESFDPSSLSPSAILPGTYALPLDAVLSPPTDEYNAREDATWRAVAECMSKQGFEFSHESNYTQGAGQGTYYGITDADQAAVYGYRPAWLQGSDQTGGQEPGATGEEPVAEVPGYSQALMGNEADHVQIKDEDSGSVVANYDPTSCWGSAMDELQPGWGQRYALEEVARQIALDAYKQSYDSQVVIDGFASWSDCMREAGFDFATPDDAYTSVWPGEVPGQDEIRTAVSDAQCKESTGLNKAWSGEIARLQTEALEKHPGLVERWTEIQNAALDAARGA